MPLFVAGLWCYPVKTLAGEALMEDDGKDACRQPVFAAQGLPMGMPGRALQRRVQHLHDLLALRAPARQHPRRDIVRAGLEGTTYEWSEYDAEHAFGRDIGHRFDPEATDLAFAETVAFFRRTL